MASLTRLSAPTQSKLRSTQILVSLPQVISELIQNALDAKATQIDIGVDCEEWSCWVRDDGVGMSKGDLTAFEEAGRYGTSKAYCSESLGEVSTFGFRGEALASAADLCCLEICSRTVNARGTWSVILKGGQTLYNGPAIRWRREQSGTVVCVRDAFYNLPIRRLSHPSPQRSIELIRKDIETFALIFPHVGFSLENTHRSDTTRPERRRLMAVPRTQSTLAVFRHLFGRALVEHVDEINEVKDTTTITGFISVEGSSSKAYQYLYINRHILNSCDLHRAIDSAFASSSFGRHALDEYMESSQQLSSTRRSLRKADKRPVYVLNITIPPREVDNCVEPAKNAVHLQNANLVSYFLSEVIQSFLVKHNFKSDSTSRATFNDAELLSKRKRRRTDHGPSTLTAHPNQRSQLHESLVIPGADFSGDEQDINTHWTDPRTGEVFVVDKRTGYSYLLNRGVRDERDEEQGIASFRGRRTLGPSVVGKVNPQHTDNGTPVWIRNALKANESYALTDANIPEVTLSSTFANTLEDNRFGHHNHRDRCGKSSLRDLFNTSSLNETQSSQFTKSDLQNALVLGQVDRKFIACVIDVERDASGNGGNGGGDILPERSLVLIDQHAAHERVRVERLIQELCCGELDPLEINDGGEHVESTVGTRRRTLDPPVMILLTRPEAERLAASSTLQAAFVGWGVEFVGLDAVSHQEENTGLFARRLESVEDDSGYAQVSVACIPEVVADKLLSDENLRDLVKSYIAEWELTGGSIPVSSQPATTKSHQYSWFRAIRQCPKNLLELVNSKACRGAIMFNDVLTLEQCRHLVGELCETALPFQCAHGRPSLVPLTGLKGRAVGGVAGSRQVREVDWDFFM